MWSAGVLEVWSSAREIWSSGSLELQHFGVRQLRKSAVLELWSSEVLKIKLKEIWIVQTNWFSAHLPKDTYLLKVLMYCTLGVRSFPGHFSMLVYSG